MKKCCRNCLYRDKYNRCTAKPISDYKSVSEIQYIPDSVIDEYVCRFYKDTNRTILNESKGELNER